MDFQFIPLSVAIVGSSIGAIWDLKTTEIPDELLHGMMIIGLVYYGLISFFQWSYIPFLLSLVTGLSLLGLGFLMYYFGQWGGADAKLLSAMGFLLPVRPHGFAKTAFPFPITYTINVFLIGAAYIIIYAFLIALKNKKILSKFIKDVKAESRMILFGSILMFFFLLAFSIFFDYYFEIPFHSMFSLYTTLAVVSLSFGIYLLWKFAKAVEDVGFKKKIPVSKLKVGDVLLSNRLWEGITEKELKKIKKSNKKYVWIKEGIRFGPSFILALIFTLYFGDGIFFLTSFL